MKSDYISQIRIAPEDATDELLAAVNRALENSEPVEIGPKLLFRLWIASVAHKVGIHHWVKYKTFDMGSKRIIEHPGRWVCTECPKGKIA